MMRRLASLRPGAGVRGGSPEGASEVELAVVLDLLDVACLAGVGIPDALAAVGEAAGGERGRALTRAAVALELGAPWDEAWAADAGLAPVRDALGPTWTDGVAPGGTLRAVAATLRRERRTRALEAAGHLGVRLVVPLAVCHLPAFVLVGLVPVLVSMAGSGVA